MTSHDAGDSDGSNTAPDSTEVLPMFPLGSVLFPSMVLPLHVFEERYRALAADVTSDFSNGEFGVALIERGSEVGGGDARSMIGTVARVVEHERFDDGRWAMVSVGTDRIRIAAWLPDDPYPVALVERFQDGPATSGTYDRYSGVHERFMRCWELASKLGASLGDPPPLADDPSLASMQIAALSPISEVDQYEMLAAESPDDRLELLDHALVGAEEVLRFQLDPG